MDVFGLTITSSRAFQGMQEACGILRQRCEERDREIKRIRNRLDAIEKRRSMIDVIVAKTTRGRFHGRVVHVDEDGRKTALAQIPPASKESLVNRLKLLDLDVPVLDQPVESNEHTAQEEKA